MNDKIRAAEQEYESAKQEYESAMRDYTERLDDLDGHAAGALWRLMCAGIRLQVFSKREQIARFNH